MTSKIIGATPPLLNMGTFGNGKDLTADTTDTTKITGVDVSGDKTDKAGTETEMVILPDPVGHWMLVALPDTETMTKSGIHIPDEVSSRERAATVLGTIIALGPDCYKDKQRFPGGPWCKEGDMVLFTRYSGVRFRSKGKMSSAGVEYRMLADDNIVGTIPEGAEVGGL